MFSAEWLSNLDFKQWNRVFIQWITAWQAVWMWHECNHLWQNWGMCDSGKSAAQKSHWQNRLHIQYASGEIEPYPETNNWESLESGYGYDYTWSKGISIHRCMIDILKNALHIYPILILKNQLYKTEYIIRRSKKIFIVSIERIDKDQLWKVKYELRKILPEIPIRYRRQKRVTLIKLPTGAFSKSIDCGYLLSLKRN